MGPRKERESQQKTEQKTEFRPRRKAKSSGKRSGTNRGSGTNMTKQEVAVQINVGHEGSDMCEFRSG